MRPRVALVALVAIVTSALVATGCTSAPSPGVTWPPGAVVLSADNLAFDTSEIDLSAGSAGTLVLVNKERQPHNVAITTERDGKGELLFRHDLVSATTAVMQLPVIPAGTYFFRCEAHPTMSGTVVVR